MVERLNKAKVDEKLKQATMVPHQWCWSTNSLQDHNKQ